MCRLQQALTEYSTVPSLKPVYLKTRLNMTSTRDVAPSTVEIANSTKTRFCSLFLFCIHFVCLENLEPYRQPSVNSLWEVEASWGHILVLFKCWIAWIKKNPFTFYFVCLCVVCVSAYATVSVWRSEVNLWELVLSSTTWVLGIEFRLPGSAIGTSTRFGIFLAL